MSDRAGGMAETQAAAAADLPLLPAGAGLEKELVNAAVYFAPGLRHIYVHNHKAACSTIKNSQLSRLLGVGSELIDNTSLHQRHTGPFSTLLFSCDPATIAAAARRPLFTAVRNPYTRLLSGYLSKIKIGDPIGRKFYDRFFLDKAAGERIGFGDFLACIATEHPRRLDGHFRHQYVNTLFLHADFEFIGSVEDMEGLEAYLASYDTGLISWAKHATNAAAVLERFYDDAAMKLVRKAFADDFGLFGYSADLKSALDPPTLPAPRLFRDAVSLRDYMLAPDTTGQPGTREIEAWRAYHASRSGSEKRAIAERALGFTDWRVVKQFVWMITIDDEFDLAHRLMDHAMLLRTQHMDHLPERLLSERGRALKRQRDAVLSRR